MNSRLITLFKFFVSITLIALLLQRVNVYEVLGYLLAANLLLVTLAVLLYAGALATNAVKWAVLLRAQGAEVPLSTLLRHTFIGVFFNNFLPIIGADVVRGYGLAREVSGAANIAVSVLVDRLIGLLGFASAGTFAALYAVHWSPIAGTPAAAPLVTVEWLGLAVSLTLLVGFLVMLSRRVRAGVAWLVARLPLVRPFVPLILKLSDAVGTYRTRPGALLLAYGVGLTTVLFSNIVNWLLFLAIEAKVEPLDSLIFVSIFNPIIGLITAIPISIGGLGVNQSVYPALYGLVGVKAAEAVAVSLLVHFAIILTSLPGGLMWGAGREQDPPTAAGLPSVPQPGEQR
jgi:uncharacterized protein (TIRG00374 family)